MTMMVRGVILLLLLLLQLEQLPVAKGQIRQQFPNLFRGGRRQRSQDNNNSNDDRQGGGRSPPPPPRPLVAIQPIEGRQVRRRSNNNNISNNNNTFEEGYIRLDSRVWNQEEIEIQLFPSSSSSSSSSGASDDDDDDDDDGSASIFRFRQKPIDQPKPDLFYGTMTKTTTRAATRTTRTRTRDPPINEQEEEEDEEEEEEEEDLIDTISLVQTKVTSSQILVVTGSVHVRGNLYQIRQLPTGELVVGKRGRETDFDAELEIEDEEIMDGWVAPETNDPLIPALEVDFPSFGRQRKRRRLQMNYSNDHQHTHYHHHQHQHRKHWQQEHSVITANASSIHHHHHEQQKQPMRLVDMYSDRHLQSNNNNDDGSRLDIMIIYTRNAMCAAARYPNNRCQASAKNKATIEGIIELAVKETNEAFAASGIPTKLRLVKLHYEDKYDDMANPWSDVFSQFTGKRDGHMDYIHAMRDSFGADFVSIIVNTRGFCGSAHRPRLPNPDRAFSMVRWDCATGHYTFTHELAHTLGCRHDRASTKSEIEPGDFNFGFQHTATRGNRFRTLMAYNCPNGGCQRILRFSNPNMSRQGIRFGTLSADNARFIRERLHIYANFRPSLVLTLPKPKPKPEPRPNPQLAAAPPASTSAVGVYSRKTKRLETVPHPGSLIGAAGNMFEVIAKKDLQITGFSVTAFAATTAVVEVYKLNRPGSFVGEEYNPDAWTLIGSATLETLENKYTILPPGSLSRVMVPKASTQAFYITFQADTNYNRYSRASQFGEIFAQNDDIQFKVGYTANYPFAYHPKAPRIFNGEIFYEPLRMTTVPTPVPTADVFRLRPSFLPDLNADTKVFQTTFASNNGYAGNLFTLQSRTDIILETFDVNAGSEGTLDLKIFTKFGDFDRSDDPSSNWIQICSTRVDGKGESVPTHVPARAVKSVGIRANDRQSFYITFNGPFMRYTSALLDPNYLGNEHLALVASAGTQFPFKSYFANRIWNGNIYYRAANYGDAEILGRDTSVTNPAHSLSEEKTKSWSYGAVEGRNPA